MNVLKPCPFCGSDEIFKSNGVAMCIQCEAEASVEIWERRTDPVKAQMLEALKKSIRKHYYCEDSWYSCPKSGEGCSNDEAGDNCNCGTDEWNNYVDKIIEAAEKEVGDGSRK